MTIQLRKFRFPARLALALILLGVAASAASTPVTLGFSGSDLTMYISVGGGPAHIVQFDTGSLGVYVPKSILGSSAKVSTTQTCSVTYVSSGLSLSGYQATAPVSLLGSKASGDVNPPPTTVDMTLCAVDTPSNFIGGLMGVGFGRSTVGQNTILELQDVISGQLKPGFILGTNPTPHVIIGLEASSATGFQIIPLSPDPNSKGDWLATSLTGCLSLPGTSSFTTECGSLLVDTGIPECILWGPKDATLGGTVPKGQTTAPNGLAMQISLGATGMSYSFLANATPNSPDTISIRDATAFSINTGRNLLLSFDYLFDAAGGNVGFRSSTATCTRYSTSRLAFNRTAAALPQRPPGPTR